MSAVDTSSVEITFDDGKFCWSRGKGEEIILAAVGDIGLSEEVNANIEKNGYIYPFEKLIPEIQDADIKFGNLECVLFQGRTKIPYYRSKLYAPADFINCFSMAGFNVLNLANNHIMDFGPAALLDTVEVIKNTGIYGIGVGKNSKEARQPAILEIKSIRIGFLGYAQNEGSLAGRYSFGAAYEKPKHIREDIQRLKEKVDHVVVSLHTDTEFSNYPSPSHIRLCHKMVNWGASLILCHHSHVPQGKKYIMEQ
jgi:poly-gamma-glutamate synthesis protein (capsule biosynthesis protein)